MILLREYDVVKVIKLIQKERTFNGSESVRRPPKIGDIGTICHTYNPQESTTPVAVEMVDNNGLTVWLADFLQEELEFVQRS